MILKPRITWKLELTGKQFLLVNRALRAYQDADAQELSKELQKERLKETQLYLKSIQHLEDIP